MTTETMTQAVYDPNKLLDTLIETMHLKNDAALCRTLGVAPPLLSKIRHRKLPVGSAMLIRIHEETGLSVYDIRERMGDRRTKTRLSNRLTNRLGNVLRNGGSREAP